MKDHLLNDALSQGRTSLNESEGKALLAAHGIRVPGSVVVQTPQEAAAAIDGMTGPFVVKVMSGGGTASVVGAFYEDVGVLQYPTAAASAIVLTLVVMLLVAAILRVVDIRKEITQ